MMNLPENKIILLFDGHCLLCNKSVQTIINNDHKDIFRFVALESELGNKILVHIGVEKKQTDSIIYYKPGIFYALKSEAVINIAKQLGGLFYLFSAFSILPSKLLDAVYDYIANNRYKWFGRETTCIFPNSKIDYKFLG